MAKHLFSYLKFTGLIFTSILVFSCSESDDSIDLVPDPHEPPNEQLESDFFDCTEYAGIETIIVQDGQAVSPYYHDKVLHLNTPANQVTLTNYITQLNNQLALLSRPPIDLSLFNVYTIHYYFDAQQTDGILESKICYFPQDQSIEIKAYLESTVGGSGHLSLVENIYVIVPKSIFLNEVHGIIKNRMCESNPFVIDCEIETTLCVLQ